MKNCLSTTQLFIAVKRFLYNSYANYHIIQRTTVECTIIYVLQKDWLWSLFVNFILGWSLLISVAMLSLRKP